MKIDLTVIVPYYNESSTIVKTLNLLANQSYKPKNIILINSTSTDNTSDIIEGWIKNKNITNINIKNICENTKLPSSSKNAGLKYADTKYIAFMDCDLYFETDWIKNQYNTLISKKLDVLFGCIELSGISKIDICSAALTYGYKRKRECIPGSILKKNVFNYVGNFKEYRSGYDPYWRNQVKKKKLNYSLPEKAIVFYMGVNYASNYRNLFLKTLNYTSTSEQVFRNIKNYILLLLYSSLLLFLCFSPKFAVLLFFSYLLSRAYLETNIKSKEFYKIIFKKNIFLHLPISALIIDFAKIVGTLLSLIYVK